MEFSYALADQYSMPKVYAGLVIGLSMIACIVGCFILFILRTTTAIKIKKIDGRLRDSALVMTIQMAKAEAAFNESKKRISNGTAPEGNKYKSVNKDNDSDEGGNDIYANN
jgi:hypothetical protein